MATACILTRDLASRLPKAIGRSLFDKEPEGLYWPIPRC